MTVRLAPTLMALGLATLVVQPCLAQPASRAERAAEHFDAGLALYQEGRMRDAAAEFLAAFNLAPHGDAMFNAGLAFDGAGDSAGAATAFAWALELGMRADAAPEAKARLARLTPRLGSVRVTADTGATIEISPLRRQAASATFYALPGDVLVSVTAADGALTARRVRVEVGLERLVTFDPLASSSPAPAPAPAPAKPEARAASLWPTLGWVSVGVGAATGVGAVVLRSATLSAKDEYDQSGHTDAAARERAIDLNRWTNLALVGAVATGAFGIGVLVLHRDAPVEVALTATPRGAQMSGRF